MQFLVTFCSRITYKTYFPSKHINVESTLKQRWSSTSINVVSTLIFGWKWKLSRRTFIDVVSTLAKQRWNNVDRITPIQCRWTNVVSTFKFWLKMKVEPTYVFRRCFNVDKTTLKQCCFNVDIWLKIKVESTYVYRRCFDVEKTPLKHLCQYLLYWCSLLSGSIKKQN